MEAIPQNFLLLQNVDGCLMCAKKHLTVKLPVSVPSPWAENGARLPVKPVGMGKDKQCFMIIQEASAPEMLSFLITFSRFVTHSFCSGSSFCSTGTERS